MGAVAKPVVQHLRLPLLSPEELKAVEEENKKDGLIPVSLQIHNYQILLYSLCCLIQKHSAMLSFVVLCTAFAV